MFKSVWKGIIENHINKNWNDSKRIPVGRDVIDSNARSVRNWI